MRRITVFGSTGSIGCNTLDLVARRPGAFKVVALSGGRNIALLAQQARAHGAEIAVTAHDECLEDLRAALAGSGIKAAAGAQALCEAAMRPADWIMSAIVGVAGLAPGLKALEQGTTLALANKESLVAAGPLLMAAARAHGATILPVDSEHSAIFQALVGEDVAAVERVIITASGGAFRDRDASELARVSPEEAAIHPNWSMGQRITVDSASLFNKALELIETREFFGIEPSRIEALVHPESVIHAMVGFRDGGLIAHLGPPDMRHAIGFALNWPERRDLPVDRLDFAALGAFTFRAPDEAKYPALRLAREVMAAGGLSGAVLNGAKERALDGFLARRIGFLQMAEIVEEVLINMSGEGLHLAPSTLDMVLSADARARHLADEAMTRRPL